MLKLTNPDTFLNIVWLWKIVFIDYIDRITAQILISQAHYSGSYLHLRLPELVATQPNQRAPGEGHTDGNRFFQEQADKA